MRHWRPSLALLFYILGPLLSVCESALADTTLAKKFAQREFAFLEATPVGKDVDNDREMSNNWQIEDVIEEQRARIEGFNRLAQDQNEKVKELSYLSYGGQVTATILPGLSWYIMMNQVKGANPVSILPGSNRLEQIGYLHALSAEEGIREAKNAIAKIEKINSIEAAIFANALVAYSSSDSFWDNVLKAGGIIPALLLLLIALGALGRIIR